MEKKDLCKKIKENINSLNQTELEEIFKMIYKNNNNYSKNINGINILLPPFDILLKLYKLGTCPIIS
jgi:hypothetical protein